MPQKLLILAHGIGDAEIGFEAEWQKVIARNNDLDGVTVRGLLWEDELQRAADMYDFGSGPLGEVLDLCGLPELKKATAKESWQTFKDYMMDVLVYVGLPDMWLLIQNKCLARIEELRQRGPGEEPFALKDTILVGHSLGAAMLPHLAWREYLHTGMIPYRGMILLASPLGFESPRKAICKDFLQRMAEMGEMPDNRTQILSRFARAWRKGGKQRLKFIANENDIVCSDVKYELPDGRLLDLIPLRQSFDPNETNVMMLENDGCMEWISFGERDPRKIVQNHDVLTYLEDEAFTRALSPLL